MNRFSCLYVVEILVKFDLILNYTGVAKRELKFTLFLVFLTKAILTFERFGDPP